MNTDNITLFLSRLAQRVMETLSQKFGLAAKAPAITLLLLYILMSIVNNSLIWKMSFDVHQYRIFLYIKIVWNFLSAIAIWLPISYMSQTKKPHQLSIASIEHKLLRARKNAVIFSPILIIGGLVLNNLVGLVAIFLWLYILEALLYYSIPFFISYQNETQ